MFHAARTVKVQLELNAPAMEFQRRSTSGMTDSSVERAERHDGRRRCMPVDPALLPVGAAGS